MLLTPERAVFNDVDFWDRLYDIKDRNSEIYARVVAMVQPKTLDSLAWELELEGVLDSVRGLIPFSETGLPTEKMMNYFVGKEVKVLIKGIDKKNKLIACTRREITDRAKQRILRMVKEDQRVTTMVSFVTDLWLGLDIGGGVIVEMDVRRAGVSRSVPLDAIYHEGQHVDVIIEKIDRETGEIKVTPVDPWLEINYSRGDNVMGRVVHMTRSNIFVLIRAGIIGIAPYQVNSEKPEIGEEYKFTVKTYDPIEKSLSLGYFDPELIRGRKANRAYWQRVGRERRGEN